jgi:hypothetical protein
MTKKGRIITGTGVAAIGILIAITPRYIFPVCEYFGVQMDMNGKKLPMGCYYTAHAALLAGLFIALIGVALMLANGQAARILSLVLAGASVGVILIPTVLFPVCKNADHHCNQGAVPTLIVLGITSLMTSAWIAFASRKSSPSMQEIVSETS